MVRAYNQAFSFTSFGVNFNNAGDRGTWPAVFRVQGQVSHLIGSLSGVADGDPKFSMVCFLFFFVVFYSCCWWL